VTEHVDYVYTSDHPTAKFKRIGRLEVIQGLVAVAWAEDRSEEQRLLTLIGQTFTDPTDGSTVIFSDKEPERFLRLLGCIYDLRDAGLRWCTLAHQNDDCPFSMGNATPDIPRSTEQ
jgi:hypothetical protein